MTSDREDKPPERTNSREVPVFFYCRLMICTPALVWGQGNNPVEGRKSIKATDIPNCPHGKMHSSQSTMPL